MNNCIAIWLAASACGLVLLADADLISSSSELKAFKLDSTFSDDLNKDAMKSELRALFDGVYLAIQKAATLYSFGKELPGGGSIKNFLNLVFALPHGEEKKTMDERFDTLFEFKKELIGAASDIESQMELSGHLLLKAHAVYAAVNDHIIELIEPFVGRASSTQVLLVMLLLAFILFKSQSLG